MCAAVIDRIAPARGAARSASAQRREQPPQQSFGAMLQQQLQQAQPAQQPLNFSKHALTRVEERGIELTPELMDKLAGSIGRASEKGAVNILALGGEQAFIINVPHSRVITTISQDEMKEKIFTNIDAAVLL